MNKTNKKTSTTEQYTSANIKAFKGLDGVRQTPAMYIGNIEDFVGARNMFFEILANSMDEALAGYGDCITVTFPDSFSCAIQDNGRGIPIDQHPTENKIAARAIFDTLHVGGKFDESNYKVASGLHGVGSSVCNALSEIFIATIIRDQKIYRIIFKKGVLIQEIFKDCDKKSTKQSGTFIYFRLDRSIFTKYLKYDTIKYELEHAAYLLPGITFNFRSRKENIKYKSQGLIDLYNKIYSNHKKVIGEETQEAIQLKHYMAIDTTDLEIIVNWHYHNDFNAHLWCNNTPQVSGSHLTGFKRGMSRAFKQYRVNEYAIINSADLLTGCVMLLSIKHKDAKYSSQTKTDLVSSQIQSEVERNTFESLNRYLFENSKIREILMKRFLSIAQSRIKISEIKSVLVQTTSGIGTLPGKLSDCYSKDITVNEIFLVEGDSATGPVKNSRNRLTQAVLPLKGKVINAYKNLNTKTLKNETVSNILVSMGTGVFDKFDLNKLRYGKIIIVTDADYDGKHIKALLITLFYHLTPDLINNGHVYVGIPPLYGIRKGSKTTYYHDESELDLYLLNNTESRIKQVLNAKEIKLLYKIYMKVMDISPRNLDILSAAVILYKNRFCNITLYNKKLSFDEKFTTCEVKYLSLIETRSHVNVVEWIKFLTPKIINDYYQLRYKLGIVNFLEYIRVLLSTAKQKANIKRYKGLGEMQTDELGHTCVRQETRKIKRITKEDVSKAQEALELLMGGESKGRQDLIMSFIKDDNIEY